jgi:hydrogenase maturation protease
VVVGVGNRLRGDDAAGLEVAARLRRRAPAGVGVVLCEQEPSRLIDAWEEAEAAVVIDAVSGGAAPGTVYRFDASAEPVPARVFRSSTHAFGVGEVIEIARALHTLPARVLVFGIEGAAFSAGTGLSPGVEAAVDRTADAVLGEVERLAGEEATCTSGRC